MSCRQPVGVHRVDSLDFRELVFELPVQRHRGVPCKQAVDCGPRLAEVQVLLADFLVRRPLANSVGAHGPYSERSCPIRAVKTNSMLTVLMGVVRVGAGTSR